MVRFTKLLWLFAVLFCENAPGQNLSGPKARQIQFNAGFVTNRTSSGQRWALEASVLQQRRKNWSSQYRVAVGNRFMYFDASSILYPLGILYWKENGNGDKRNKLAGDKNQSTFFSDASALVFLLSTFQSMGYHIKVGRATEIIPYHSLLRIRYDFDREVTGKDDAWQLSATAGIRFVRFGRRTLVGIQGEGLYYYYPAHHCAWQVGATIGINRWHRRRAPF